VTAVDLSARARQLLKVLVECYIVEGDPVGSKTLAACSGVRVSSATVRNVMAELEGMGLVTSPHASAGRVPTLDAFKYFVNHLLEPRPVNSEWQEKIRQCFDDCQTDRDLVRAVAQVLSELTQVAGIVTLHARASARVQKIEFLPQSNDRVLVLLVLSDAQVNHTLVTLPSAVSAEAVGAAQRWVADHWVGERLLDVADRAAKEVGIEAEHERFLSSVEASPSAGDQVDRSISPEAASKLAAHLMKAFFAETQREDLIVTGQANLISQLEHQDLVHLEQLYRVLDSNEMPLPGWEAAKMADNEEAVRVLIADEAWQSGNAFSFITSAYGESEVPSGRLALVGPLRMPYAQLIPLVGWVAKILGSALKTEG